MVPARCANRVRSALHNSARSTGATRQRLSCVLSIRLRFFRRGSRKRGGMAQFSPRLVLAALVAVTVMTPHFTAQPPTAEKSIEKDRTLRQAAAKAGVQVATTPKWGFFGTIFHLILEQINDTKSAYTQISDLLNNQFVDDNAVTKQPAPSNSGSTETPKISRQEFLRILDRNLKGLARLRNLEWREAKKDSLANMRGYKDEIFRGKKPSKRK